MEQETIIETQDSSISATIELRKESCGERFGGGLGNVATILGMIPFAGSALLLTDKLLEALGANIYWRILPDLVVGGATLEGKRRLVFFFGQEGFKALFRITWWQELGKELKKNPLKVITILLNIGLALVPSTVFAYITGLAFDGMAQLLRAYKFQLLSYIANVIENKFFKLPFWIGALFSNWVSFPIFHRAALHTISNEIYQLAIEHPKLAERRKEMSGIIESQRLQFKALAQRDINNAKQLIKHWVLDSAIASSDIDTIRKVLLQQRAYQEALQADPSYGELLLKHGTGFALTSLAIWGFKNIITLGADAAKFYGISAGWVQTFWGWSSYGSMGALSIFLIYPFGKSLVDFCFKRDRATSIFSTQRTIWILTVSIGFCLLGSAQNGYQQWLVQPAVWPVINSLLSQLFLELYGFYLATTEKHTRIIEKTNPDLRWVSKVDQQLRAAANLIDLPYETLKQLADSTNVPKSFVMHDDIVDVSSESDVPQLPHYRDWLNTLLQCCSKKAMGDGPINQSTDEQQTEKTPLLKEEKSFAKSCLCTIL